VLKRKKKKKSGLKSAFFYLLVVIALIGGVFSAFYSDIVYKHYLLFYYHIIRKDSFNIYYKELVELYKSEDSNDFLSYATRLSLIYPERKELKKIVAAHYFKIGENHAGFLPALQSLTYSSADIPLLERFVPALFAENMYSDLLSIGSKYRLDDIKGANGIVLYYGAALYETGNYKKAVSVLSLLKGENSDPLYYLYLGKSCEKQALELSGSNRRSMFESALSHHKEGLNNYPGHKELYNAVVRVLKELKRDNEAAELIGEYRLRKQ